MTFHPTRVPRLGAHSLPHPHKFTRRIAPLCLLRYPLVLDPTTLQLQRTTGHLILGLGMAFHLQLFFHLETPVLAVIPVRIASAPVEPWAFLC